MSERLKQLIDKSRGTVKTESEIVEGEGREVNEFGDATQTDLFGTPSELDSYTPQSPKGWNGKYPEKNEAFYNKLNNIVDGNKQ